MLKIGPELCTWCPLLDVFFSCLETENYQTSWDRKLSNSEKSQGQGKNNTWIFVCCVVCHFFMKDLVYWLQGSNWDGKEFLGSLFAYKRSCRHQVHKAAPPFLHSKCCQAIHQLCAISTSENTVVFSVNRFKKQHKRKQCFGLRVTSKKGET